MIIIIIIIIIIITIIIIKERFSVTFTSNGKGECVPRDQVSQLLVVYCSLTPLIN